jgi:hypothetical protein
MMPLSTEEDGLAGKSRIPCGLAAAKSFTAETPRARRENAEADGATWIRALARRIPGRVQFAVERNVP